MSQSNLVPVYSVGEPTHAELVKDALELEGIPCFVEGENQGSFVGVLEIRLLVPADRAVAAREFILEHEDRYHDEEE